MLTIFKHKWMVNVTGVLLSSLTLFFCSTASANNTAANDWFDSFKQQATDEALYRFLYAMPKGGDLHHHLSGSNKSEWWYELATDKKSNGGYQYYTKTQIKQCNGYGLNQFGSSPSLLLFKNISEVNYQQLSACEQSEYTPLEQLSAIQKKAWLNSIRLDKPYEGRDEFFQTHWQRLNELTDNPYIAAQMLLKNMQAYADEGLLYLEAQANAIGHNKPDGSEFAASEVAEIFRALLASEAAKKTGVTVRLQASLLRFHPKAEKILTNLYEFVDVNRDLYVGINFVGREDNDKGHPLRFLQTLRDLRKKHPAISLSIHAGEVDEPNKHVRNTLLLGADRIGHGLNLITDPDTMLLMRHNRYLVEINLISNLLLEYIDDYSQHPFPEYLRTGIPVALSTDDRGMWDSNLTDEFFVATKSFNLSWQEIKQLSRNSIQYSFVQPKVKQTLLTEFDKRIQRFEQIMTRQDIPQQDIQSGMFICKKFTICLTAN